VDARRCLLVLSGLVAAAIAVQLVPLPAALIARVSPATDGWLRHHDLLYAFQATTGDATSRALSVAPAQTRLALLLFVAFALFATGLSGTLSRQPRAVHTVAGGLVLAGALLALVGLAQGPVFGGKLYGIWDPLTPGGSPFGPFVNRNHFAGWMLMALPVGLGYLAALVSKGVRHAKPGWRGAVLWLGGPDATRILLVAVGVGLMMLTLVFNLSRSGVGGLVLALAVMAWFSLRHQASAARKVASVAYLAVLSLGVAGWAGADVLASRFTGHDGLGLAARQEAWRQARAIAVDFPLVGTGLNTYGLVVPDYEPSGPAEPLLRGAQRVPPARGGRRTAGHAARTAARRDHRRAVGGAHQGGRPEPYRALGPTRRRDRPPGHRVPVRCRVQPADSRQRGTLCGLVRACDARRCSSAQWWPARRQRPWLPHGSRQPAGHRTRRTTRCVWGLISTACWPTSERRSRAMPHACSAARSLPRGTPTWRRGALGRRRQP
jgi:hypothetical protein